MCICTLISLEVKSTSASVYSMSQQNNTCILNSSEVLTLINKECDYCKLYTMDIIQCHNRLHVKLKNVYDMMWALWQMCGYLHEITYSHKLMYTSFCSSVMHRLSHLQIFNPLPYIFSDLAVSVAGNQPCQAALYSKSTYIMWTISSDYCHMQAEIFKLAIAGKMQLCRVTFIVFVNENLDKDWSTCAIIVNGLCSLNRLLF